MKRPILLFLLVLSVCAASAQYSLNEGMQAAGFRENLGQIKDQHGAINHGVKYMFSAPDFNLQLKENSFSYELVRVVNQPDLSESGQKSFSEEEDAFYNQNPVVYISRVDVTLEGANPHPQIITGDANGTYFNYFLNMKEDAPVRNVQCYNRLMYKDIYPHIDLLFIAGEEENSITYEWYVHPGGNPEQIRMVYAGEKGITEKPDGTIDILSTGGYVTEGKPYCFTFTDEKEVTSAYSLKDNKLSYKISGYDHSQTLVIDPTLMWATFYGGELDETVFENEIVVDALGKIVMCGSTYSTTGIATNGAWDETYSKFTDIFIVKFLQNGKISWGTYYGGKGKDGTFALTADYENNLIVTGSTDTDSGMATVGAYKDTLDGASGDLLLSKFKPNGDLLWATYYGGTDRDHIRNCIITKSNNILFCGFAASKTGIAYGSYIYQDKYGKGGDALLGQFTKDGWPIWVTYWGDEKEDRAHVMCFDTAENYMYVAGTTESIEGFIINSPFQHTRGGVVDGFLSYWDTSGHYYWGTYVGGNYDDRMRGVVLDGAGNVYVAGYCQSTDSIASPGAHQETWGGGYGSGGIPNDDGFLMKFDHSGHYKWGTYYGGSKEEFVRGLDIDSHANLYIVGDAQSNDSIATPDGFFNQKIANDNSDAMFAKWDSSGNLLYGSYLGSDKVDEGDDVFLYQDHFIYIALETKGEMPVTPDAYEFKNQGGADVMLYQFETGANCYDEFEPNETYQSGFLLKAFDPDHENMIGWFASIATPTDQDWFLVKPRTALPNYMVIIDKLTENYDIVFLNKQGVQLGSSTKTGTEADTLVMNNLAQGRYYVGIVHDTSAYDGVNCYRLRIYKSDVPYRQSAETAQDVQPDMFMFPNPAHDKLNVNLLSNVTSASEIVIYDMLNRIVYHSSIELSEGYQQFEVPVSSLQSGAYQLVISNGQKFWAKNFVKE